MTNRWREPIIGKVILAYDNSGVDIAKIEMIAKEALNLAEEHHKKEMEFIKWSGEGVINQYKKEISRLKAENMRLKLELIAQNYPKVRFMINPEKVTKR